MMKVQVEYESNSCYWIKIEGVKMVACGSLLEALEVQAELKEGEL